jgi:hypothetical protein
MMKKHRTPLGLPFLHELAEQRILALAGFGHNGFQALFGLDLPAIRQNVLYHPLMFD